MKDRIKNYGINKLLLLILFSMFYFTVHSQTYYFSNSGDDSYTEEQAQSPDTPWKTLDKLNSLSLSPGATILFKKGDVWRGQITVKNSGSADNPITFGAYGTGNKPVISGSIIADGWTLYDGSIYQTKVSGKVTQLFFNDKRQQLARTPNTGYLTIDAVNNSKSFTDNDLDPSIDWTGGQAIIRSNRWRMYPRKITSFSNGTLNLSDSLYYGLHIGWGYFINNKPEALDSPGEWYFDSSDSTLYFWSPNGNNPENDKVEVTVNNYGFWVNSNQDYIVISDLNIKYQTIAGILAYYSSHITIKNCEIYDQDGMGIRIGHSLWGYSDETDNVVENNIVRGANQFGIFFSTTNSELSNNEVSNIGIYENLNALGIGDLRMSSGIAMHVTGGNNKITGNRVDSIGYIGINFSNAPNTLVEYNYVTRCCLTVDDGGGIYTYTPDYTNEGSQGSIIRKNIVTDIIGAPWGTDNLDYYAAEGIYIDGLSHEITIEDNTSANCGNTGLFMNAGRNNTFKGNISYNNNQAQIYLREHSHVVDGEEIANIENIKINNNVLYSLNTAQLSLKEFSLIHNDTDFGTYNYNYYCNPYTTSVIDHQHELYTLEGWQAVSGQDADSHKSLVRFTNYVVDSYGPQLILNSTFDSNITYWHYWSNTGDARNTWEENPLLDGGSLKHDPAGASSSYASHNVEIEEGSFYELKFSIVSDEHISMRVAVIQNHSPYSSVGLSVPISSEPARQDLSFLFKGTMTDNNSMLYFYNADKPFWIDNVSLRKVEISYVDPKAQSPLFINPSMETVSIDLGGEVYRDLDGKVVSGNITLEPFSSKVLTILLDSDTVPPAAPANLTATAVSSNRIDLDWDDNTESDLAGYTVKRATTSGGPYTSIATGVTSSNYSDTGLSPETTYYYVVSAKDNSNNSSENSAEASATTPASEPLPVPYSFYDFEEGTGILTADLGSLKNDGTLTGDDINWATGGVWYSDTEKDGCVQITGTPTTGRSYVKVPFNNLHNSYNYTFSAWVKWDTSVSPDWAYVFWQNGDDSKKTRHVDMWWDKEYKTVATSMNDENGGFIRIRPTGTSVNVFDGNWHLVAITMENGTNAKLWVDGQKTGEITSSVKVAKNGGDDLWLGTMPEDDPDGVTKMVGFIDRVGIYDKALTAEQMAELYRIRSKFDDSPTGFKKTGINSLFRLYQNTPNPFNSETTISYELKQPGYVTLQVFDITGKIVATLEQGENPAGFYRIKWDRLSANNSVVPRGIYLCKLDLVTKNNEFSETMKIVVK